MSYARRGADSSVYVYASEHGDGTRFVICDSCSLPGSIAHSSAQAVTHQHRHIALGDRVPVHLIKPSTFLGPNGLST